MRGEDFGGQAFLPVRVLLDWTTAHSQEWLCHSTLPRNMRIRPYSEQDLTALQAIHAKQGFDYSLPDLGNPLFVTKLVLTGEIEDAGSDAPYAGAQKILGAALLRLTAEAYLLLDPQAGSPRERWQWLQKLHAATEQDAWQRGLEDVHAWLPPPIAGKFGKHLARLGWLRDDTWTPYCKRLQQFESNRISQAYP
jgi:hypothetical protein